MAIRRSLSLLLTLVALHVLTPGLSASCPCSDERLCDRISFTVKGSRELVVYTHTGDHFSNWHWRNITTVIKEGDPDNMLMCRAHAEKAKYGTIVKNIPSNIFSNRTEQYVWLKSKHEEVIRNYYDVVSFDIQDQYGGSERDRKDLLFFVHTVSQVFRNNTQIAYNMPVCVSCADEICSDIRVIARTSSFLTLEFCGLNIHSETRPKGGSCIAKPVLPYASMLTGIDRYIIAGVPLEKIVMGIPWFGYNYECGSTEKTDLITYCHVSKSRAHPQSGACKPPTIVHLNDHVTLETVYKDAREAWVEHYMMMSYNYHNKTSERDHQVWIDEFTSIDRKFQLAKNLHIRGVAVFYADYVQYDTTDEHQKYLTKTLWQLIDTESVFMEDHPLVHWNSSLAGLTAGIAVIMTVVGVFIGISIGVWLHKYKLSKRNFAHQRITEEHEPMNSTETEMNNVWNNSGGLHRI